MTDNNNLNYNNNNNNLYSRQRVIVKKIK